MEKVKAAWNFAASWTRRGWTWVNLYTNGPLLALILFIVCAFLLLGADARAGHDPQPSFPPLIDMDNEDLWPIYTEDPAIIIFCQDNPGADNVHLCQAWGMVAPSAIIPVSAAVYCFVYEEREVIREDGPVAQRRWGCGMDRSEVAAEALQVGKEVKRWGRPIRDHETEVAI